MISGMISEFIVLTLLTNALAFNESQDRMVDQAAMELKNRAILQTEREIERSTRGMLQASLLERAAKLYQEKAELRFRISKGNTGKEFLIAHKKGAENLGKLIANYPKFSRIERAYFSRAKSLEALKLKQLAKRDYLRIVNNFSQSSFNVPSLMAVSEIFSSEGNFGAAENFLSKVVAEGHGPYYGIALHKLAWAQFQNKDLSKAVLTLERTVSHYLEKAQPSASDVSSLENAMFDLALFYLQAFEDRSKDLKRYLLGYQKFSTSHFYKKGLVHFGKLLRAHDHDAELLVWCDLLASSGTDEKKASLTTLTEALETFEEERKYKRTAQVLKRIQRFYERLSERLGEETDEATYTALAETAQSLQKKTKQAVTAKSKLTVTLSSLAEQTYESIILVKKNDQEVAALSHYNLGELFSLTQDYGKAVSRYRKSIETGTSQKDASLKAIQSFYQKLKKNGEVPSELKIAKLKEEGDVSDSLRDWIFWVDQEENENEVLFYRFEAARILYAKGLTGKALKRFLSLSKSANKEIAEKSSSIVLDTYASSDLWEERLALSQSLQSEFGSSKFSENLEEVRSQTAYEIILRSYQAKDFSRAEELMGELTSQKDQEKVSFQLLGAQIAFSLEKYLDACERLSSFLSQVKGAERVTALQLLAIAAEKTGDLTLSLQAHLELRNESTFSVAQRTASFKKALSMAWVGGAKKELKILLGHCPLKLQNSCEEFRAISGLKSIRGSFQSVPAAIASIMNLTGQKSISMGQLKGRLGRLQGVWQKLRPEFQFEVLVQLSQTLPVHLEGIRMEISKRASIESRVRFLVAFQGLNEIVAKLPWTEFQVRALSETGKGFVELANGLNTEADREVETVRLELLSQGKKLLEKAHQIAVDSGVLASLTSEVRTFYASVFADSFSDVQGASLKSEVKELHYEKLKKRIEQDAEDQEESVRRVVARWDEGLQMQKYNYSLYLLTELRTQVELSDRLLRTMGAALFLQVGTQAEAISQLEDKKVALRMGER